MGATPSYAHSGEDVIVQRFLMETPLRPVPEADSSVSERKRNQEYKPTYLDIEVADPVIGNNTYLFYTLGCRGVLVEPNIDYVQRIRTWRPGDTTLNIGIGVTEQTDADFYCYNSTPQANTFDKALVEERMAKTNHKYDRVIRMPLVPINKSSRSISMERRRTSSRPTWKTSTSPS